MEPDKGKIRISRFLAMCGLSSRRKCEELVLTGKIRVNGKIVNEEVDWLGLVTKGDDLKKFFAY